MDDFSEQASNKDSRANDQYCGDYPAPCNCDEPETHDGAVTEADDAVPEVGALIADADGPVENSAADWQSAIKDGFGSIPKGELAWYGGGSPRYAKVPEPAQIEAARRFLSHWLESDNHGFIIPDSEWGKSLKHWLHILVATPAPGGEGLPHDYKIFPDTRDLLAQVRSRGISPTQWIYMLTENPKDFYNFTQGDFVAALREAKRMKAEDEAATRRMLDRN